MSVWRGYREGLMRINIAGSYASLSNLNVI